LEVGAIDLSGKLIVFEGLDFSGKTSQIRLLATRLAQEGLRVTITREPGGTAVGEAVRNILVSRRKSGLLPMAELALFVASRAQLWKEVIKPALKRGDVVLSSRFRDSSVMYQGWGRGISCDLIELMNDEATEGKRPDLTFFIDVPVGMLANRRPGAMDRIEQEFFYHEVGKRSVNEYEAERLLQLFPEFSVPPNGDCEGASEQLAGDKSSSLDPQMLRNVRDGYLDLVARDSSVVRIDGSQSATAVAAEVVRHLLP